MQQDILGPRSGKEWVIYVLVGVLHPKLHVNLLWMRVYSMWVCVYWPLVHVYPRWVHVYSSSHTTACVYPIPVGYKIYFFIYFITAHLLYFGL